MKTYMIQLADLYGRARAVTVKAYSVPEALDSLEIGIGEHISGCYEVE